ncbi:hypothetical protein DV737_g5658, partial [Chaetothyriales sp. CBS 132003]
MEAAATPPPQAQRRHGPLCVLAQLHSKTTPTHITSPSLCRHVFDRLAPTLQQHRGCNLITIGPAGSLRSCFDPSHALLSPHVLAATNHGYATPNHGLLIAANLSGAAVYTSRFLGSQAAYFFNDLYAALFGLRDDLFRHGLVRVLAWLPDTVTRVVMPRGVEARSKQSIKLEAAFAMTQVAGTPRGTPTDPGRRWHALEAENYRAVQSAAKCTPASRRDVAPLPMLASLPPDPTVLRTAQYASRASFVHDWLHLDAELRAKYPDWFATRAYAAYPRHRHPVEDRQLVRWRQYYTRAKTLHMRHQRIASAVGMQRAVDAKYRALFAAQSRPDGDGLQQAIDDYRAYDSSPRALEWNKRTADPLVVHADEFMPEQALALIVLTPRPSFRTALDTDSKVTCFDYVLNQLSSRLASSVPEALQRLIHGPVDDFVETVPSLTDPVKGGCPDLAQLRVRSLPASTFVDIAVAYEKWPLRPDITKMMLEMSKEVTFLPDDE